MQTDSVDDYLDEDPVIPSQRWALISILAPNSVNAAPEIDMNVRGFKIRGVYEHKEDAERRKVYLNKIDPYHHIFLGPVGRWLPWDDDADNAEEAVFAEGKLNEYMKQYKEQEDKIREYDEERKQNARKNAQRTRAAIEKRRAKKEKKEMEKQNDDACTENSSLNNINNIINKELVCENVMETQKLSVEELTRKTAALKVERENFVPEPVKPLNEIKTSEQRIEEEQNQTVTNIINPGSVPSVNLQEVTSKIQETNDEINNSMSAINKIDQEYKKAQEKLAQLTRK